MGSSGSGNLSDYSGSKPNDGAGKSGGASGENKCQKALYLVFSLVKMQAVTVFRNGWVCVCFIFDILQRKFLITCASSPH